MHKAIISSALIAFVTLSLSACTEQEDAIPASGQSDAVDTRQNDSAMSEYDMDPAPRSAEQAAGIERLDRMSDQERQDYINQQFDERGM